MVTQGFQPRSDPVNLVLQTRQYLACVNEHSPVSAVAAGSSARYPKACLASTGIDLVWFTWSAVEMRGYLHANKLGLLEATSRSPQL